MSNIEKVKHLKKALNGFIIELQDLAESMESENDFNNLLVKEVAPMITEDDQVFGASVFYKLDLAVEFSTPLAELKNRSLKQVMCDMSNSAICELINFIDSNNDALKILREVKQGYTVDPERAEEARYGLAYHTQKLQDSVNGELFERIQLYANEIKELKGEN